MAEAIGLASGLVTLAGVAYKSSIALSNTIQSFKTHPKKVRDLNEELETLSEVLQNLTEALKTTTSVDLSALDKPLERCNTAIQEFEKELLKCVSHSGGDRRSFRDWAKLKYMGDDINSFTELLSQYKATITIALTGVNFRASSVTAESIRDYQNLIRNTTDDLNDRLHVIDEKLEILLENAETKSESDAQELNRIKEERLSTQNCLQICNQLSERISEFQREHLQRSQGPPGSDDSSHIPERVTNEGLQECKESLKRTASRLEKHMEEIFDQLTEKSKTSMSSEEEISNLAKLRDEWEATRQFRDICFDAETHLKESTSLIDNYAKGDETVQFLVSTTDKTINGKNQAFGHRTRQVGGHFNDDSLQQLSKDISSISYPTTRIDISPPRGGEPSDHDGTTGDGQGSKFKGRYGPGFKLPTKIMPETAMPPETSRDRASTSPER